MSDLEQFLQLIGLYKRTRDDDLRTNYAKAMQHLYREAMRGEGDGGPQQGDGAVRPQTQSGA